MDISEAWGLEMAALGLNENPKYFLCEEEERKLDKVPSWRAPGS